MPLSYVLAATLAAAGRPFLAVAQEAKQLLRINDEGDLVLEEGLKNQITGLGQKGSHSEPVYPLVLFGKFKTGKSTLATMISCTMSKSPVHFPSHQIHSQGTENCDKRTMGLWVSPPFRFNDKTFVMLDMEGLDDTCSSKIRRHALVKIIAMLTEVAAVFLQTTKKPWDVRDQEIIGIALKDTREHLISASEVSTSDVPSVRSKNHAALIIVKPVSEKEIKDSSEEKHQRKDAKDSFDHMGDVDRDFQRLLVQNFDQAEDQSVEVDGRSRGMPWAFQYLPEMRAQVDGKGQADKTYDWMDHKPFESGEGCEYLEKMSEEKWAGTIVPLYGTKLEELSSKIVARAVKREVTWGNGRGSALTGPILWDVLEYGVQEMNNVGPLPDDEMWRLIMGGGCEKKCKGVVDSKLGPEEGVLKWINELLDRAKDDDVTDAITLKWDRAFDETKGVLEPLYHESFTAVRDSCKKTTEEYMQTLVQEKENVFVKAKLSKSEADLVRTQKELENAIFEQNKFFYTIWLVAAAILAMVVMYMWKQVNMTCRSFYDCFGGFFTRKRRVESYARRGEDGEVEMGRRVVTQSPAVPGAWRPSADGEAASPPATAPCPALAATSAEAEPELGKRIAALERLVLQLAARDDAPGAPSTSTASSG
eukprot:CAMPEP_0172810276 /NCGR_PEP_ID=MMETSP1075-20121228/8697_1 /TAXON_ID=2916 /ORGANISM="Ceratium fusus, Strain PA161109" /LENGTH=646 /DNA_ID=CAMNT_0013649559 /DNA_START=60 /DNA_END=1997 /DNA_ORIENTATION=+